MTGTAEEELGVSLSANGKSFGKHDDNGVWRPWWIKLDLVSVPETGNTQTVMRHTTASKKEIFQAATALNMDQTSFMRLACIGLARAVLAEVAINSTTTFRGEGRGNAGAKARRELLK